MTDVFNPQLSAVLEGYCLQSRKAAAWIPLYIASMILNGLVAAGVMLFEFEILYRVFSYLAGDDSEYWSPSVMGLTSFILVVAIHYLAEQNKQHPVLTFVNKVAGFMSVIYLIGIGLLLSLLIFADAGSLFDPETFGFTVPLDVEDEQAGVAASLMAHITSPVAKVLFSFGIGALAITNVFVAHHAISKTKLAATKISGSRDNWRQDAKDMATYRTAKKAHREVEQRKQAHNTKSDETLRNEVVADVLLTIADALTPILAHINNALFMNALTDVIPGSPLNPEQMQKAVKPIQAITAETLHKHMN